MNDPTIDRNEAIDCIAAAIHPAKPDRVRAFFQGHGIKAPILVWSPDPDELRNPLIVRFAEICRAMPHSPYGILASDFNRNAVEHLADWLILLDVEDDGKTFRYRYYGAGIEDIRGSSMLGLTSDEFGDPISQYFTAVYRAACVHKQPLLTGHELSRNLLARTWERLVVPLFESNGKVIKFANLAVPDTDLRPGLEVIPDPVLIADKDQIVRYANRAAREMFGRQIYLGAGLTLFDFAGIDIDLPIPPAELAASGKVQDVVNIVLCDTMIERFLLTVSGIERHDGAFYVITLRPMLEQRDGLLRPAW